VIYERHRGGWFSLKKLPLERFDPEQDILIVLQNEIKKNEFDEKLLDDNNF
jgi:hypothetical protein